MEIKFFTFLNKKPIDDSIKIYYNLFIIKRKEKNMDWKEKVFIGMIFIQKGCTEAGNYNCDYCSFEKYCAEPFPSEWFLEKENNEK